MTGTPRPDCTCDIPEGGIHTPECAVTRWFRSSAAVEPTAPALLSHDDFALLPAHIFGKLETYHGVGKVPSRDIILANTPTYEAKVRGWGIGTTQDLRRAWGLADAADSKRTRMALDPSEVALIEEHRRKTATIRAYNEGVEAAAELVLRHGYKDTSSVAASEMRALAALIRTTLTRPV